LSLVVSRFLIKLSPPPPPPPPPRRPKPQRSRPRARAAHASPSAGARVRGLAGGGAAPRNGRHAPNHTGETGITNHSKPWTPLVGPLVVTPSRKLSYHGDWREGCCSSAAVGSGDSFDTMESLVGIHVCMHTRQHSHLTRQCVPGSFFFSPHVSARPDKPQQSTRKASHPWESERASERARARARARSHVCVHRRVRVLGFGFWVLGFGV